MITIIKKIIANASDAKEWFCGYIDNGKAHQPGFVYAEQSTSYTARNFVHCLRRASSNASTRQHLAAKRATAHWRKTSLRHWTALGRPRCDVGGGCHPLRQPKLSCIYVPQQSRFLANDYFTRHVQPMLQPAYRLTACISIPNARCSQHAVAEAVSHFKQGRLKKQCCLALWKSNWTSRWRATGSSTP